MQTQEEEQNLLVDLEYVAIRCNVSIWTIRKYIKLGRIYSVKIGARRLVPRAELIRLLQVGTLPELAGEN